jgi:hypothetical protein
MGSGAGSGFISLRCTDLGIRIRTKMSRIPNIAFLLGYSRKQKQKIPFSASLITASLITGEPAGAYEAGHQADPPHPRLVLRGEEPQSLRDKLNRARK